MEELSGCISVAWFVIVCYRCLLQSHHVVHHLASCSVVQVFHNSLVPSYWLRKLGISRCHGIKHDMIKYNTLSQRNDVKIVLRMGVKSYVYWTVHRLDSWIKRDQLDVTCFIISWFNVQHVSDVNTSILRTLRLICWVISWVVLLWFDVCWCYVVVWLWWCGIRMQAEACIRIPHHYSHTTT